ncbi:hypothetical protein THRCLA_06251 [Thraustotheca clavata]|uniref:LNR domain-containing protein n=1 Tax=Thraustotheca clavata TaxID=74557 RepID=A0A1V9ZPY5_9STRA|nr:hypothetical protein THRCLA_06251 [Thraustotheca clavata]
MRKKNIVHPAENTMQLYLFGRRERKLIRIVSIILLTTSMLYLLCFSAIYLIVPPDQGKVLWIWKPKLCSLTCFFLGLLHLYGTTMELFCTLRYQRIRPSLLKPLSRLQWIQYFYYKYFSRYGPYGILGRRYEVKIMVKQTLQIPLQIYLGYRVSLLLTDSKMTCFYTMVLALNCLVIPALMFLPNTFARRWGLSFLDTILTFLLSSGIPMLLIFRAMVTLYFAGNTQFLDDHVWLNQSILLGRFVVFSGPFDYVAKVIPFFTCYLSIRSMTIAAHIQLEPSHNSELLQITRSKVSFETENSKSHSKLYRQIFTFVSTCTSFALIYLAYTTIMARDCPQGCILQTYTWFYPQCDCIMFRINCLRTPLPNNYTMDEFIQQFLQNVFDIDLVQCDLPNALTKATMQSMQNLYSFTLQRTNTVKWDISPSDFPPSMFSIFLYHLYLPQIPQALSSIEGNLQYLFLRNVSLYLNNTIPATYNRLAMLDLTNASLNTVPVLVIEQYMNNLKFTNNNITELPSQLASSPWIDFLHFINNSITTIPPTFANALQSNQKVYMEGNPINYLSNDINFQILESTRLSIRQTPLCDRLWKVVHTGIGSNNLTALEEKIISKIDIICKPECAIGCFESLRKNTRCDIECYTPACNFDDGDCDFIDL